MTQTDFILELAEIVRTISDKDFDNYREKEDFFFSKFPHLKDEYIKYNKQHKQPWHTLLREIRYWKELDLSYMYPRIMQLAQEFKGNLEYFEIETDYGTYIIPDRILILTKLEYLSHKLINDIYPQIEQSLNYESNFIKINQQSINGKIDWHETILNAVNQSLKHPISFTNLIPTQEFDTPENLLLLTSLFWIRNDAMRLMRYHLSIELSRKELSILQNIFVKTEAILGKSILRDRQDYAKSLSMLNHKDHKIDELISKTSERIHLGLIKGGSYNTLLEWINEYIHFNTERFIRGPANYRVDRTEDVDTMYELWILFEFMRYLQTKHTISFQHIIDNGKFHGFEIIFNEKRIRLKYQESYTGQLHERNNPDYTFEINDENIPLVLDAKNWKNEKKLDAKDKMFIYLGEFFSKKTKKGILFFPNNSGLIENSGIPYYEKRINLGNEERSIITCVLKPSRNSEIQKQNEIVFENISQLLNILF
jgi:hypothetical protein